MVEAYVAQLKPLADKISETKYKYSGVEDNENDILLEYDWDEEVKKYSVTLSIYY